MKWVITTPPTTRPVDWNAARAQLRLTSADDKDYVESLIDAAGDYAQEALSGSLVVQTITATIYQGEDIALPRGPVIAVSSVTDFVGNSIAYTLERVGFRDRLKITAAFTWPLTVVYTAGYASAAAVPASIRQAILMHVATLYEVRASVAEKALLPVPHSLEDFYRCKARTLGIG